MNTSLLKLLPALVAATATLVCPAEGAQPKPGDAFPAFNLFQFEGTMPELKGKVVLVDFWASWCPPCKASFPALNELHQRYASQGVVILAINVDEKRTDMEAFLKKTPAQFAVVRDAKQKLVAAASVETMPTSFVLDRDGRVRFVHSGFKGSETKKKYEQELDALLSQPKQ